MKFDPLESPSCKRSKTVSTLGMQPMIHGVHPYMTRFNIIPRQFAIKFNMIKESQLNYTESN